VIDLEQQQFSFVRTVPSSALERHRRMEERVVVVVEEDQVLLDGREELHCELWMRR